MISLDKNPNLYYILIIRKPLVLMTYSTSQEIINYRGFSFFLTIYLMVGNNKLYRLNPNRFVSYRISEKRHGAS